MAPLTRDPAAFQRLKRQRAIEKAVQVRRCYEEYNPPQIQYAFKMMTCMGIRPVLPVHAGRGMTCLTTIGEDAQR